MGDTVVVFGAGTVGLLVAAMARRSGASTVLIADLDHGRVEYAIQNGFATHRYVVAKHNCPSDKVDIADRLNAAKDLAEGIVAQACMSESDFEGADVTFDCTGKEICMQAGLYVSYL